MAIPSSSRNTDMDIKPNALESTLKSKKIVKDFSFKKSKEVMEHFNFKEKSNKKAGRIVNPFVLFAKENRSNIPPTYIKDKKCHISTILGNMWKVLPADEKEIYIEKAKMFNLRKSRKDKVKKLQRKKSCPKKVGRPKKVTISEPVAGSSTAENQAAAVNPSMNYMPASSSVHQQGASQQGGFQQGGFQQGGFQQGASQQGSCLDHHNQTVQHDPRQPRLYSSPSQHFLAGQSQFSYMSQHSAYTPAASKFYGGTGMIPPFFMPYQFPPFWMYPQMAYQMYLQSGPHPSAWGFPHNYYENSYLNSYCFGREAELSNFPQSSTASAAESRNQNESLVTSSELGSSDQEPIVVDDENTANYIA